MYVVGRLTALSVASLALSIATFSTSIPLTFFCGAVYVLAAIVLCAIE